MDSIKEEKEENEPHVAVLRRVALFMDGMARAITLPFGPTLVHRLVSGNSDSDTSPWPTAAWFSFIVSIYIIGRWLGTSLAFRLEKEATPIFVARLGGILLSLHVFTYGAGLDSAQVLVAIRFLTAVTAGFLCGLTRSIRLPEDDRLSLSCDELDEDSLQATRRREGYIDIASGTAKIYLIGFTVSIISGGLLFRKATKDSTFQTLTGASLYTWSPLFLISVAAATEVSLRWLFDWTKGRNSGYNHDQVPLLQFSSDVESRLFDDQDNMEQWNDNQSFKSVQLDMFQSPCRSRHGSTASMDEFYDCRSILSDGGSVDFTESRLDTCDSWVAKYVDGKCVYPDGSPAFVPAGDSVGTIPESFMKFYSKNLGKALKAWQATQSWRKDQTVWNIHSKPNTFFYKVKEAYPHFVHGYSKAGYPVIYEQPGKMNLKSLFASGCQVPDMLRHYIFFMEFVSNRICTKPEIRGIIGKDGTPHCSSSWGTMVVLDIKGAGLGLLSGDVIRYLKEAGDTNSQHYPLSMKRAFVINAPFFVAGAWSGLKNSIVPASVQVDLLSESKYLNALREFIDDDQIPPEYGGSSPYKLGEHPYEVEFEKLASDSMKISDESVISRAPGASPQHPRTTVRLESDIERGFPLNSPPISTSNSQFRRRLPSMDKVSRSVLRGSSYGSIKAVAGADVIFLVSVIHCVWSALQGAIETTIPLWMLSSSTLGGLGYSPSRSGITMFVSCLILLWVLRTRPSRLVSRIPCKAPLRALRIGAGSEAALLGLLAFVAKSREDALRTDSVFVMTTTIVATASLALASMLGRSASKILHRIATESYLRDARQVKFLPNPSTMPSFKMECEMGRWTAFLNIASEVIGSIASAAVWSSSVSHGRFLPFDSALSFVLLSLSAFALYAWSFSLYLNPAGEFAPHPEDSQSVSRMNRLLLFLREIVSVSGRDMASLFEESNWATNPVLISSRSRSRTLSGASVRLVEFYDSRSAPVRGKVI